MKILIVDLMHPSLLPLLQEQGFEADYRPDISKDEVSTIVSAYDGLIVRSKLTITASFLEKAPNLKFIARAGAGMDQIDVAAAQKQGVHLLNAPEGNRDAVAEHAVGMLLCLFNKLRVGDQQVRQGIWDREGNRGLEIMGKTVGIIGYGNTGRAFSQRLQGFGCRVLAYDKYVKGFGNAAAEESTLEAIFDQADVLSLHIPLTSETQGWVNEDFLYRFKKNIFLINTARGELVPLADLRKAIESGKVVGACLDVLENEKLKTLTPAQQQSFAALTQSEQVLFTPHVAGWTHESYVKINETLVRKIMEFARSVT
jgi:D-3-phosphoglycerate dehydrogenase